MFNRQEIWQFYLDPVVAYNVTEIPYLQRDSVYESSCQSK